MSLELFHFETQRVSAHHHIDIADGMGVSLHVTWPVLTIGGTIIL